MASSNPFRKQTTPIVTDFDASSIPRASRPPPPVSFGSSDPKIDPEVPVETKTKAKVVKRVRVLSPPPLSPDSPEWPNNHLPAYPQDDLDSTDVVVAEADKMTPTDAVPGVSFGTPQQGIALVEEMKNEGEALKAGNKAMDVDAFKRLLMTGDKPASTHDAAETVPKPVTPSPPLPLRQAEEDESMSDSSMTVQFGSRKKAAPPPPPSSRHGKAIRSNTGASDAKATSPMEQQSFAAEPRTAATDIGDESSHETPPKKSTPAAPPPPPPPRGHARSDSKAQPSSPGEQRSSPDAAQSQSQSSRHSSAPVPPPPRRPNAGHRMSSSQTSPTSASFPDAESHDDANDMTEGQAGPSRHPVPPPPPPARNSSVRRPPSAEAKSKDSAVPPPPPPTRKRGTSKGNADRPNTSDPGQGDALLADLSALQREVDAAMGKLG
ncbi:uncharacterized protein F5Z01DRAFT_295534 [Emericellopsis atlantica]|uniref:Uncharacterized protein n=1 Tax=Emericellopsis atlantica TaxID=2614577 RepID=A0A9P7ZFI2_9HYPO|nr:uncharacterized protein F5Z01DRAFT_295534 [Emericellopsis atlantica]KAG9251154.1 hypothetical protein F5Z01DRAFT_295534 [Emericellopsis atlantica]